MNADMQKVPAFIRDHLRKSAVKDFPITAITAILAIYLGPVTGGMGCSRRGPSPRF
jgi:hypothetical protein